MIITNKEQLSLPCEQVGSFDEAIKIIDLLDRELSASPIPGVGLAANQIGINKQVCILRPLTEDTEAEHRYKLGYNIANPQIVSMKVPFIMTNEGCLSFPDQHIETIQYGLLVVKDLFAPEGRTFRGLAAAVALHEIQHLFGSVMYDRMLSNLKPTQSCVCKSGKEFRNCCAIMMRKNKVLHGDT